MNNAKLPKSSKELLRRYKNDFALERLIITFKLDKRLQSNKQTNKQINQATDKQQTIKCKGGNKQ